jgi:hypothetical protein
MKQVLLAMLGEWIDLMVVPIPMSVMIYADHDEYAMFFARKKAGLTRVIQAFSATRVSPVLDYQR